jgi:hypothetical protein
MFGQTKCSKVSPELQYKIHIIFVFMVSIFQKKSSRVEDILKLAIPAMFVIFNCIYWPILLTVLTVCKNY